VEKVVAPVSTTARPVAAGLPDLSVISIPKIPQIRRYDNAGLTALERGGWLRVAFLVIRKRGVPTLGGSGRPFSKRSGARGAGQFGVRCTIRYGNTAPHQIFSEKPQKTLDKFLDLL
jgi:hypothetical protein